MTDLSLTELKEIACKTIDSNAGQLGVLASDIWEHPEEYYQEFYAHRRLTDYLETEKFEVTRSYVVETAFRATHGTENKPHVAILYEYDALPSIGHACGHNLIAEVGVGAGIGVRAAMVKAEEKGQHLGKVNYILSRILYILWFNNII